MYVVCQPEASKQASKQASAFYIKISLFVIPETPD